MDQHDGMGRPGLCSYPRATRSASRNFLLAAAVIGAVGVSAPSFAADPKGDHEIRRLSKFEARHIREACRERALEKGLHTSERAAFLTKCYFGRARSFKKECTQQGVAKGLEKAALQDFVHVCVKERRHPKVDAAQ